MFDVLHGGHERHGFSVDEGRLERGEAGRFCEFFFVAGAEDLETVGGVGVVPGAELGRRGSVVGPEIDLRSGFGDASGPEAVDEDAEPVGAGG